MKESEKNVEKEVMIHLIISNEGAVHKDTVKRLKDYSPYQGSSGADDTEVLKFNVEIVGMFFNKESWVSQAQRKAHPEDFGEGPDTQQNESKRQRSEWCC